MIPSIKDSAGKPTNSSQKMKRIWSDFYVKLYSSDKDLWQVAIGSFFKNTELQPLSKEQNDKLHVQFTESELSTAFNFMPNNKSLGLIASLLNTANIIGKS